MELKIEEYYHGGEKGGTRRVNVVPSHEKGGFVVRDSNMREHRTGRLGLPGISREELEAVETGSMRLSDLFELGSDALTFQPKEGVEVVYETKDTWWHGLQSVVELAPVPVNLD